jgi:hypothetical protein
MSGFDPEIGGSDLHPGINKIISAVLDKCYYFLSNHFLRALISGHLSIELSQQKCDNSFQLIKWLTDKSSIDEIVGKMFD